MKTSFKYLMFSFFLTLNASAQKQIDSVYCLSRHFKIGDSKQTFYKNYRDERIYLGDSLFYFYRYKNDSLIKAQFSSLKDTNLIHNGQCIEYKKNLYSRIYTFKDGEINGSYFEFYENSLLKIQSFIKGNLINGNYCEYYENGKIKSIGKMKNGLPIGTWKYFYKSGHLNKKGNYIVVELNKSNEKLYIDFIYDWVNNGVSLKDGVWQEYEDNSKIVKLEFFKEGKTR